MIYKKFIDNGNGDCIYCRERSHDCRCDEYSAVELGYTYRCILHHFPINTPDRKPDESPIDFLYRCMEATKPPVHVAVWRKGKTWFRNSIELVDYHNAIGENK